MGGIINRNDPGLPRASVGWRFGGASLSLSLSFESRPSVAVYEYTSIANSALPIVSLFNGGGLDEKSCFVEHTLLLFFGSFGEC